MGKPYGKGPHSTQAQKKLSTAALRAFQIFLPAIFKAFRTLLFWGSARRRLHVSYLCCHASFVSASTPGPAHQSCAPRGHVERGASSAAVESMTSAISVAKSLAQMPSGVGGSAAIIAFAIWHRRFGSVINRRRSAVLEVSLALSLLPPRGLVRTFAYT